MHVTRVFLARLQIVAAASAVALIATPGAAVAASPDADLDREAATAQKLRPQSFPTEWWWDESAEDTARARALLRRMTLDEKVDMLHGEVNYYYGFYNAPIERSGIPALTMADGPAGVRIANPDVNDQQATSCPRPWPSRRPGTRGSRRSTATGRR